jgi:lysine-specific permease
VTIAPFTLVFQRAGLTSAASIMNAVIFIAILSACNSSVFAASRTLLALAESGKAPVFFSKRIRGGVPIWAVTASFVVGCIAFLGIFLGNGAVFEYLLNLTGMSGVLTWISIAWTHLRFRRAYVAQGKSLDDLSYTAPFFPYGSYLAIALGILIMIAEGYVAVSASQNMWTDLFKTYCKFRDVVGLVFFFGLYFGYKVYYKTKLIPLDEVDFSSFSESQDDLLSGSSEESDTQSL